MAQGQFLKRPPTPTPRTYLLGHRALPLGAVFFWTFTGNLGQLYLGREDKQTALPQLPLSMVKASETLHPGRGEAGLGQQSLSPRVWLWPRDLLKAWPWGCWSGSRAGAAHLPRFSWVMTEGGGLTLSVPPGQKLLVIHVTFSSTTCTWGQ